jgi:hypothetical protein
VLQEWVTYMPKGRKENTEPLNVKERKMQNEERDENEVDVEAEHENKESLLWI